MSSADAATAFFEICDNPTPPDNVCVSLYRQDPFYGGPEEGGWWGNDTSLVAYQKFVTREEAEARKAEIQLLVEKLNKEAKRNFGDQCRQELEWCEARNLDPEFLGEVDGETHFFVCLEDTPGSQNSRGSRHYE